MMNFMDLNFTIHKQHIVLENTTKLNKQHMLITIQCDQVFVTYCVYVDIFQPSIRAVF